MLYCNHSQKCHKSERLNSIGLCRENVAEKLPIASNVLHYSSNNLVSWIRRELKYIWWTRYLLMRLDTTFLKPFIHHTNIFITYMQKSSSHIFRVWSKEGMSCNIASEELFLCIWNKLLYFYKSILFVTFLLQKKFSFVIK